MELSSSLLRDLVTPGRRFPDLAAPSATCWTQPIGVLLPRKQNYPPQGQFQN